MDIVKINTSQCISKCELCGDEEELRPYGPGGKWVCFPCGMKDEENASRMLADGPGKANILIVDAR